MPDTLFSLTPTEFGDLLDAYLTTQAVQDDRNLEVMAWQTSLLMSATGNYGKKGVEAKKLYKRQYDDLGTFLEDKSKITPISQEEKDRKLNELLQKFKKD
jgi:hypothetical protein